MRRMSWHSAALLAAGLMVLTSGAAGCGDDDGCTDECDVVSSAQCSDTFIQICTRGSDGCLGWVDSVDCANNMQICDDSTGNVICASDCTDQCPTDGDTQCNGTQVETCNALPNGCLDWEQTRDCADVGQLCEDYTGDASCMDECVDECTALTDTQCNGTVIESCITGPDGCLDWDGGTDCADTSELCDDSVGDAGCVINCAISGPTLPAGAAPAHQAVNVDETSVTSVDWADSTGAASYDVYFSDSCPPPTYPDNAFQNVTTSELTGLTLTADTRYCWQVVAIDSECAVQGPVWSFHTTCVDPTPGVPTVTSALAEMYAPGTTSGSYTLTFSEDVVDAITGLTWTPVTGSGSLGTVTQVDPQTYTVPFSGAADGDSYTLTVGTSITDVCGNPLSASVDIVLAIDALSAGTWASCADYGTLQLATPTSPATLPTGDTANDGSGSCYTENGADIIARYVATSDEPLLFQWSNVVTTTGSYRNYEIWRNSCDPTVGVEEFCANITADNDSVTIDTVTAGDVFYMKAIAETAGADFSSATFQVDTTVCAGTVAGPPTVTSGNQIFQMGVTSGTYTLRFSEPVFDVLTNLTWTPVTGSATMGTVVQVDTQTYTVPFSGAADGDVYSLTVSTGVTDDCGSPLQAPVYLDLEISAVQLPFWTNCGDAANLTLNTPISPPQLPTGDVTNTGSGSCWSESGADIVAVYVATTYDPLEFTWSNVNVDTGSYRNYEVWKDSCESSTGVQLECANLSVDSHSFNYSAVAPGDVFYMKAIAESSGADFTSAVFEVSTGTCVDEVPGAPTVSSGNQLYGLSTVDGTYVLRFNEDMFPPSVSAGVIWTPVTGSATLGTVTRMGDYRTYAVPFQGAAAGDEYTLSVATTVTDVCGTPITAQVDITIEISSTVSSFWASCSDVGTLTLGTPSSPPQLPTGDTLNDGSGSCYTENGADIIASYTATTSDPLEFSWSNVNVSTGSFRNYEIWRNSCYPGVGVQEFCDNVTTADGSKIIYGVSPGDVFYMKAIAETSGADFTSATFLVQTAPPPPLGTTCYSPAQVTSANHTVDGNSHDCWSWTGDVNDTVNDHEFTCDNVVGGDVVVEYTTGAGETTLQWDATISNYALDAYIGLEVTESSCTSGSSLYCTSAGTSGTYTDANTVTVQPNTTYYIWVSDAYADNPLPDVDICLWSY